MEITLNLFLMVLVIILLVLEGVGARRIFDRVSYGWIGLALFVLAQVLG